MIYKVFLQSLCNFIFVLIMWSSSFIPMKPTLTPPTNIEIQIQQTLPPPIFKGTSGVATYETKQNKTIQPMKFISHSSYDNTFPAKCGQSTTTHEESLPLLPTLRRESPTSPQMLSFVVMWSFFASPASFTSSLRGPISPRANGLLAVLQGQCQARLTSQAFLDSWIAHRWGPSPWHAFLYLN